MQQIIMPQMLLTVLHIDWTWIIWLMQDFLGVSGAVLDKESTTGRSLVLVL